VRAFWTVVGLVGALALQSVLSLLFPRHAQLLDPFLLVVVYSALTAGETHGMLVGTAAGWMQDVHFGGRVQGLSALTKLLVGFAVGVASARFHLAEPSARVLVIFAATVVDALVITRLAAGFSVPAHEIYPLGLLARACLNAALGLGLYEIVDRRLGHERRRM
jgi:rod shape-determining protein MreD